jgi:hypothetical protein
MLAGVQDAANMGVAHSLEFLDNDGTVAVPADVLHVHGDDARALVTDIVARGLLKMGQTFRGIMKSTLDPGVAYAVARDLMQPAGALVDLVPLTAANYRDALRIRDRPGGDGDGGAAATLVHAYFDTGTRVLGIAYAGTVVGLVRIKIGPETDAAALHTLLLDHRFRGLGVANAALHLLAQWVFLHYPAKRTITAVFPAACGAARVAFERANYRVFASAPGAAEPAVAVEAVLPAAIHNPMCVKPAAAAALALYNTTKTPQK